jgi:signal transduction histidine kinase
LNFKNRTKEEKHISKVVLLGSTFTIILVSSMLAFILIRLQVKEFNNHLVTFKDTLIQREKFTIKTTLQNLKEENFYEQKAREKRVKQKVKNQVEIAKRLIEFIYKKNKNRSNQKILKEIKKSILSISNKKKGVNYFILQADGTFLLNTKYEKFEGENFIDFADLNGKKFIQKIIEKSKIKNSYVDFLWYMPNSSKIEKKVVFSRYIHGLNIIIGSSRYLTQNNYITKYLINKLSKRRFSNDEFLFMYKLKSLNNINKYSDLLLEKNIYTKNQTKNIIKKILIKSNYEGDIFFAYKNQLMYSIFLKNQRIFLTLGVNLKNINKIIENETKISNQNLNNKIFSLIVSIAIITLVFFILSYFISQKIEKIFKNSRLKVIRNERKYQLLFNHSNDGFIISNITNEKKAIIVSTNLLAKKLTAYRIDLIGKDFFRLLEDFDIKSLFKKGEFLGRVVLDTKDNFKKIIELNCVIYNDNGEKLLFASLRDISERVSLLVEKEKQEKLLIQKSKMAAMGEMIGNIAHQWRQPLSQLSGLFFDIDSAYDYGELDKKFLSARINEADDLVEYMSKTIDDFREFFNPNSKKETFDLLENIKKTLNIINSSLKYHNIQVDIKVDEKIQIDGYSSEFSQVLLNIFSNSKETAIIRNKKSTRIKIYSQIKKDKIIINIEDNCGGIKDEIMDKIFEPYFTTKYNYGTGVGLYMSKIIIENKMGGKILAKNIKNKGARFTIIL